MQTVGGASHAAQVKLLPAATEFTWCRRSCRLQSAFATTESSAEAAAAGLVEGQETQVAVFPVDTD